MKLKPSWATILYNQNKPLDNCFYYLDRWEGSHKLQGATDIFDRQNIELDNIGLFPSKPYQLSVRARPETVHHVEVVTEGFSSLQANHAIAGLGQSFVLHRLWSRENAVGRGFWTMWLIIDIASIDVPYIGTVLAVAAGYWKCIWDRLTCIGDSFVGENRRTELLGFKM